MTGICYSITSTLVLDTMLVETAVSGRGSIKKNKLAFFGRIRDGSFARCNIIVLALALATVVVYVYTL